MSERIKNALQNIGIPCYFLTRGKNNVECIVYNYISSPLYYADNTIKATRYTVLLNVYLKANRDIEQMKADILETMREYGFQGGTMATTMPETTNDGLVLFNTPITFNTFMNEIEGGNYDL